MRYSKTIFSLVAVLFVSVIAAQGQSKVHFDVDYHYSLGVSQHINHINYGRGSYKMGGHSLHLTGRYDITDRLSTGIGIGLDRYTEPEHNTLPIFATIRYKAFKMIPQSYAFTNIGCGIGSSNNFTKGIMWDAGIGYTIMLAKHFGLNFQLAYGLKTFNDSFSFIDYSNMEQSYQKNTSLRHSVSFGLGLTF